MLLSSDNFLEAVLANTSIAKCILCWYSVNNLNSVTPLEQAMTMRVAMGIGKKIKQSYKKAYLRRCLHIKSSFRLFFAGSGVTK